MDEYDNYSSRPVRRFVAALRARNEPTEAFSAVLEAFARGCRGLRLLPQDHTAETWPWWVQAFANDRGQLVVFHIAQGSADGGASLCADDDGVVLDIKKDTPPDVAQTPATAADRGLCVHLARRGAKRIRSQDASTCSAENWSGSWWRGR